MKLTDLELVRLANNIQELLYNASDICHDRSVKFLMARAKVRGLGQTAAGASCLVSICFQVTAVIRVLRIHGIHSGSTGTVPAATGSA